MAFLPNLSDSEHTQFSCGKTKTCVPVVNSNLIVNTHTDDDTAAYENLMLLVHMYSASISMKYCCLRVTEELVH